MDQTQAVKIAQNLSQIANRSMLEAGVIIAVLVENDISDETINTARSLTGPASSDVIKMIAGAPDNIQAEGREALYHLVFEELIL